MTPKSLLQHVFSVFSHLAPRLHRCRGLGGSHVSFARSENTIDGCERGVGERSIHETATRASGTVPRLRGLFRTGDRCVPLVWKQDVGPCGLLSQAVRHRPTAWGRLHGAGASSRYEARPLTRHWWADARRSRRVLSTSTPRRPRNRAPRSCGVVDVQPVVGNDKSDGPTRPWTIRSLITWRRPDGTPASRGGSSCGGAPLLPRPSASRSG